MSLAESSNPLLVAPSVHVAPPLPFIPLSAATTTTASGSLGGSVGSASVSVAPQWWGSAADQLESKATQAPSNVSFLSVTRYQPFFNVDTSDVLQRMRWACLPTGASLAEALLLNADLYSSFWVTAAVVFLSTATGSLNAYFTYERAVKSGSSASWTYDITKVTTSISLFYGYVTVLPLLLYGTLRCWGSPVSPTALCSLYGYALTSLLPVAVLVVVPVKAVQWLAVLSGGLSGALCIMLNLRHLIAAVDDRKRRSIVLAGAGLAHMALAISLELFFWW